MAKTKTKIKVMVNTELLRKVYPKGGVIEKKYNTQEKPEDNIIFMKDNEISSYYKDGNFSNLITKAPIGNDLVWVIDAWNDDKPMFTDLTGDDVFNEDTSDDINDLPVKDKRKLQLKLKDTATIGKLGTYEFTITIKGEEEEWTWDPGIDPKKPTDPPTK